MRRYSILLITLLFFTTFGAFAQGEEATEPPVVEVTAQDYAFEAPDKIPSGWVTLHLNNTKAKEIHEIDLGLLPEGVTYADFRKTLPVWSMVTERTQAGELVGPKEVYAAAKPKLPKWYGDFREPTARGLVSPGHVTEKTVYLEPGTYAMFCFVKSPEGQAHISLGMIRKLVVTDESTGASNPKADAELTIGVNKIHQDEELSPGTNTILARFKDEHKGLKTIHLVRVEKETDLEKVEQWLDWYRKGGLQAPAPAEFLGGTSEQNSKAPQANVAYFTVKDLKPGRYAWVVRSYNHAFSKTFTIK